MFLQTNNIHLMNVQLETTCDEFNQQYIIKIFFRKGRYFEKYRKRMLFCLKCYILVYGQLISLKSLVRKVHSFESFH